MPNDNSTPVPRTNQPLYGGPIEGPVRDAGREIAEAVAEWRPKVTLILDRLEKVSRWLDVLPAPSKEALKEFFKQD